MRTRWMTVAVASAVLLGACGGGDDTAGTTASDTSTASETASETGGETSGASEAAAGTSVAVASSDLGDILVDGDGMTLYAFLPDGQGTPTCTGGCAQTWPPFAGPATAGDGADASLLGTAEHPEAGTVATYDGWPLYHFASDAAPGDTNGQGLGGNWYVVAPDGTPVDDDAGESEGAAADTGYGY